jgi:predicted HAD superfamily Cof-like phosphohydrolase
MSEFVNSKWVGDIAAMHTKFGVNTVLRDLDADKLKAFLDFRIKFLQEELDEMIKARSDYEAGTVTGLQAGDDTVDALVDLCVVAIGTLNAFDVDADEAWNRVHKKNMEKEVGIKASRPNPLGLPDLIKPEGWTAPVHHDNIGLLSKVYGG